MRYREHRGGLAESLATTVEVADREALIEHIRGCWPVEIAESAVHIKPYGGDDARCGWRDVHLVIVDGLGPVGMVEGPIK